MTETGAGGGAPLAREHGGSTAHNVVVMKTVELIFQKSPGIGAGDHREIANLRYQVRRDGAIVRTARVAADGKISVRCPPGITIVDLLVGRRVVASYEVTFTASPLSAANTVLGRQRRLRMLGYHLGHDGPTGDGVDGLVGGRTERAVLDYQADKGLAMLGTVDGPTQNGLTNDVGG